MDALRHDLRYALRALWKTRLVTLVATLSLALAVAGNATVFSLVYGIFFRPLPYPQPERICVIGERARDLPAGAISGVSVANFLDWQERQTSFEQLAAVQPRAAGLARAGSEPEPVVIGTVTEGLLELLGVRPVRGRALLAEDGTPGAEPVALVSHTYWTDQLGAAPLDSAVIRLDGRTCRVVGVLPADFQFLFGAYDVWIPRPIDRAAANRQIRQLLVFGRLAPGRTQEQAGAELDAIMAALTEEYPEANRGYEIGLLNLRFDIPSAANRLLFGVMQGSLILVLLIACANLTNLLLARGQTREREIAIRMSLGAGRRRIARLLLTESALLALGSGALGLGLSVFGVGVLRQAMAGAIPGPWQPAVEPAVVAFTAGVTLLVLLLLGILPVFQSHGFRLASTLRDGALTVAGSGSRKRLSRALVVAEVTLSLVLLGGAAVLIKSFLTLQNSDPGFATSSLLTFDLRIPDHIEGDEIFVENVERIRERLRALPGVEAVTAASIRPRTVFLGPEVVEVDGRPPADDGTLPQVSRVDADEDFLPTLGIPLLAGRGIETGDRLDAAPVVLVNQAMAHRFWGEESPLGHRVSVQGVSREVVGVVATVRHGVIVNPDFEPTLYLPWAQRPARNLSFALRTAVPPATLAEAVRREVLALDSDFVLRQILPLEAFLSQFYAGQNMLIAIMGGFGVLALLLAALGTYGVLAYWVVQRRHEIGIRMALGSSRGRVVHLVAGQGLAMGGLGILIGTPGVILLTRALSAQISVVVPVEPVAVVAVGGLLLVVVVAASLLPAWRAASVDPVSALRPE